MVNFYLLGSIHTKRFEKFNVNTLNENLDSKILSFQFQLQTIRRDESADQNTNASSDHCYGGNYDSYKTSTPLSQILNNTFENLHYNLSMNDHDNLFNL